MNLARISNILLLFGILLSLIGLVYKLGYVNSIYFQYCFGVGIILFGISVLFSVFSKTKQD